MREKCGLIGIASQNKSPVSSMIVAGLMALQHRGQESWGVAVPSKEPFHRLGLVSDEPVAAAAVSSGLTDLVGIGHVRYSTSGPSTIENAQPLDICGEFCIAHNGTISNIEELFRQVKGQGEFHPGVNDTGLVGERLLALLEEKEKDWFAAFDVLRKELDGAYCFLCLTKGGEVYAARDERGFRPLCLGWHEQAQAYVVTSESIALARIGASLLRDVKPGEIIRISPEGIDSRVFANGRKPAHCAFEYTYFAHPTSVIQEINVYEARKNVGRLLARKYPLEGDIVIPVPDSARPAALGYSQASKIPFEEGLMKDRYGRKGGIRSFIEPNQKDREDVNRRVVAVEPIVRGKHVIVVDDSIVRGTSSKSLVNTLRAAGARRISLLLTFPPIRSPCYMGIDFPSQDELVAYQVGGVDASIEEVNRKVAEAIGVDFVGYNDAATLAEGIGLPLDNLCTSCATGDYGCLKTPPVFKTREQVKGQA